MRALILALLLIIPFYSNASIQQMVDALPAEGGEVKLECGVYVEGIISVRSNVAIIGSGPCTVIPSIDVANGTSQRSYNIRVENLIIDAAIDGREYIGLDLRGASTARIDNVMIRNVQVGVFLSGNAYYNSFEDLIIDASVHCFEFIGIANENVIRGGRCHSRSGLRDAAGVYIQDANSIKIYGTSFETLDQAVILESGSLGILISGIRAENVNCGVELRPGSSDTVIISMYQSNINAGICGSTPHQYYGF